MNTVIQTTNMESTIIDEIGVHYIESMLISSSHMPIWGRCIIMLVFIFLEYVRHRTRPQNQKKKIKVLILMKQHTLHIADPISEMYSIRTSKVLCLISIKN